MRIYYKLLGSHYHCRVFFNGKAGDLVVGASEWGGFQRCFNVQHVQFIEDGFDPVKDR